jgi:tetratricopeptide (TPR) repeat protein
MLTSEKLTLARRLAEVDSSEELKKALEFFQELDDEATEASESPSAAALFDRANCAAWFASALETAGLFDEAEAQYKTALLASPSHALALGNYACFLHKIRKDKVAAAAAFEAAVEAHPNHVSILVKFAGFKKMNGDLEGAEKLYNLAVVCARPDDGDPAGAYAVFLHAIRHDEKRAQEMYERAARIDPEHTNNLSNYGLWVLKTVITVQRVWELKWKLVLVVSCRM